MEPKAKPPTTIRLTTPKSVFETALMSQQLGLNALANAGKIDQKMATETFKLFQQFYNALATSGRVVIVLGLAGKDITPPGPPPGPDTPDEDPVEEQPQLKSAYGDKYV